MLVIPIIIYLTHHMFIQLKDSNIQKYDDTMLIKNLPCKIIKEVANVKTIKK